MHSRRRHSDLRTWLRSSPPSAQRAARPRLLITPITTSVNSAPWETAQLDRSESAFHALLSGSDPCKSRTGALISLTWLGGQPLVQISGQALQESAYHPHHRLGIEYEMKRSTTRGRKYPGPPQIRSLIEQEIRTCAIGPKDRRSQPSRSYRDWEVQSHLRSGPCRL
jgi:hypothetical protein